MEHSSLEKTLWTDQDYEHMGWHDCRIHTMAADPDAFEFALDIDYIFEWVHPNDGGQYFSFWISPVTMVFENAFSITIAIDSQQGEIEIDNLLQDAIQQNERSRMTKAYRYQIKCQEGQIALQASGFKMYVRQPPRLVPRQRLTMSERGGISIEKTLIHSLAAEAGRVRAVLMRASIGARRAPSAER